MLRSNLLIVCVLEFFLICSNFKFRIDNGTTLEPGERAEARLECNSIIKKEVSDFKK
jgi:hypothetical protein